MSSSPGSVSRPVHLLTELAENEGDTILKLKLTDSNKVWEGSIGSESMVEYGSKHNIDDLEEYLSVTHGALTGKTTHPPTETGESSDSLKPWEFELKTDDIDVSKVNDYIHFLFVRRSIVEELLRVKLNSKYLIHMFTTSV